jgi:hypothetical protein
MPTGGRPAGPRPTGGFSNGARTTGGFPNGTRSTGGLPAGARAGDARSNGARYNTGGQRPPWDYEDYGEPRGSRPPASDFPTQTDGFRTLAGESPTRVDGFRATSSGPPTRTSGSFATQADDFLARRRPTIDGGRRGATEADERASAARRGGGLLAGALSGFIAAGTALGVGNLTAAFFRPQASPIIAVGGVLIQRTPPVLKNFAVQKFGQNEMTALLLGMYITIAVLALVLGMMAWRQLPVGVAGLGLFGLFGAFIAYTRPESRATDVIPSLVGALVGIVVLVALTSWTRVRQRSAGAAGDVWALGTGRSGWAL